MKVKHSKYKNTGILFELLTRQLTSDTIAGNQPKSLSFLKKHFNSKTFILSSIKSNEFILFGFSIVNGYWSRRYRARDFRPWPWQSTPKNLNPLNPLAKRL